MQYENLFQKSSENLIEMSSELRENVRINIEIRYNKKYLILEQILVSHELIGLVLQ